MQQHLLILKRAAARSSATHLRAAAVPFSTSAAEEPQPHTAHSSEQEFDNAALEGDEDTPQLVRTSIRVDLLAQQSAAALAAGRAAMGGLRPDLAALRDDEEEQLRRVKTLVPQYGVRPSLLGPFAAAAFHVLGAASAVAPPRIAGAVASGVQDALTDTFNAQLREMREEGVADEVPEFRKIVRALRDQERAPSGATPAPDLMMLQRMLETGGVGNISPEEGVAAVVKAGTRLMLEAAKRV